MPTITVPKLNKQIEVPVGSNLMSSLLEHNVPVASSCNGDGICGKCKMEVLDNPKGLSDENPTEQFLKLKMKIDPKLRISCQCLVQESISVTTTYW